MCDPMGGVGSTEDIWCIALAEISYRLDVVVPDDKTPS